ncbi:hypothetical protein FRC02_012422 [Tulasnella sp. 418]|nr:hypothetical protein FRC02_012422 [Tulasnella sp. 418]
METREYQQSGNPNYIFYPTSLWTIPCVLKLLHDDYAGQVTETRWQACIPEVEAALRQETEKIVKEVKSWYKACTTSVIEDGPSDRKSRKSTRRAAKKTSTKEAAHDLSLVTAVSKCRHSVRTGSQVDPERHHYNSEKLSGPGALVYDRGLREIAPKVLAAMNYDPLTATVQNLVIAPGDMYACDRCDDKHQDPAEFGDLLSH